MTSFIFLTDLTPEASCFFSVRYRAIKSNEIEGSVTLNRKRKNLSGFRLTGF